MSRAPQQWFRFGPWAFDVTGSARILRKHPRPAEELPVEPWVRAYAPLIGLRSDVTGIARGPGGKPFSTKYAREVSDLARPLLVGTLAAADLSVLPPSLARALPATGDGGRLVLLDGMHRVWLAQDTGTEMLPCHVLTAAETALIRGTAQRAPATWRPKRAGRRG